MPLLGFGLADLSGHILPTIAGLSHRSCFARGQRRTADLCLSAVRQRLRTSATRHLRTIGFAVLVILSVLSFSFLFIVDSPSNNRLQAKRGGRSLCFSGVISPACLKRSVSVLAVLVRDAICHRDRIYDSGFGSESTLASQPPPCLVRLSSSACGTYTRGAR